MARGLNAALDIYLQPIRQAVACVTHEPIIRRTVDRSGTAAYSLRPITGARLCGPANLSFVFVLQVGAQPDGRA